MSIRRCTQYTPHNTPTPPSASHQALSMDVLIVEILSFLTEPNTDRSHLFMSSPISRVCRSWLKNSANALRNTLAAQHTLSDKILLRYVNLSVQVAALYDRTVQMRPPSDNTSAEQPNHPVRISKIRCSQLHSLELTRYNESDPIYDAFPENTLCSFLQQPLLLQSLDLTFPSSRLAQDISSSCTHLTSLSFSFPVLLPHREDLLKIAAASPSIHHLHLHIEELTGFEGLDTVITAIPSLTSLDLLEATVPESAMQAIRNSQITRLRLSPDLFREPWCRQFGPYLGNITHLTLGSGIAETETDQLYIADEEVSLLLQHTSCLTSLNLTGALDLTDQGLKAIGIHCPQLTDLNLTAYAPKEYGFRDHFTITGYRSVVKKCLKLRSLNLKDRYTITNRQIKYLQQQHPSLHINHQRTTL
jgi:hypothetical protein